MYDQLVYDRMADIFQETMTEFKLKSTVCQHVKAKAAFADFMVMWTGQLPYNCNGVGMAK